MCGLQVDLIMPPIEPLTEAIIPTQFSRMPDGAPATNCGTDIAWLDRAERVVKL